MTNIINHIGDLSNIITKAVPSIVLLIGALGTFTLTIVQEIRFWIAKSKATISAPVDTK